MDQTKGHTDKKPIGSIVKSLAIGKASPGGIRIGGHDQVIIPKYNLQGIKIGGINWFWWIDLKLNPLPRVSFGQFERKIRQYYIDHEGALEKINKIVKCKEAEIDSWRH